jgi:hypothetical protein
MSVAKKKAKIASVPAYQRIAGALVKEIQSRGLNPEMLYLLSAILLPNIR